MEKPRYSRVSDIIDLATFMQSKALGVTISEIEKRYNVSRRTAERMRDSLTCIFPQIDEIEADDKQKHWGFIDYSIKELISFTAKEIANIEQLQRRTTNKELKNELGSTIEKLKALNSKNKSTVENHIEMIMQTEGYAVRQMPEYKISTKTILLIRDAIQKSCCVSGIYHEKKRLIEPLGMIYGEKIFLIAREKAKGNEIYTYFLHKFEDLKITDKKFERGDFDLQKYSKLSFGVYHGEILRVKLQFFPSVAQDALKYNFHPTQKSEIAPDGSAIISFRASGDKEIMWHIFKWGNNVKILAPKKLQNEYKKYLKSVLDVNLK